MRTLLALAAVAGFAVAVTTPVLACPMAQTAQTPVKIGTQTAEKPVAQTPKPE